MNGDLASFCLADYESAVQLRGLAQTDALARLKDEFDHGGDASCRVGSRFGPFRLLRLLGRGQLARVYEAEHTITGAIVAVKVVLPWHCADRSFRLRMSRNLPPIARVQLAEPHLGPIYEWGETDERCYIVMPVIDGMDLGRVLVRHMRLPPAKAVGLVSQIATALDALHSQDWMHRNVSPGNIFLGRDHAVLLAGLRYLASGAVEDAHPLQYAYSAPETLSGDATTFRSDIYALTCVFYECLTGHPPYPCNSLATVLGGHLRQPVPRLGADIPALNSFDGVIARGMAKEPKRRFATAGALALAARQALATAGPT
ncbi:serine/threonine-protein kinase [Mycobacterium asiaticum]|uniref:non-specific serine/threonine protein kinase n=1 Tax=Mycobacterium asiaticum TaxID=1790 RepID=A0A1A3BLZ4_MYCAS|nr:serine/threonine-protein kinase [Mycobacterium asiaticum]OBI76015.1 hypothetical protein A9X01_04150 [Mycobacterium asiaticum]